MTNTNACARLALDVKGQNFKALKHPHRRVRGYSCLKIQRRQKLIMIKILSVLIELILGGVIIVGCYSQLVRPMFRRTPVFPFFRKRPNLEGEIEKVDESLEDKELRKQLARKQKQLGK